MLDAEDYLFHVLKTRILHLIKVQENINDPEIIKDYFNKRLNRIIIDYMLREDHLKSAKAFVEESAMKVNLNYINN
jgi:hypothetical protein